MDHSAGGGGDDGGGCAVAAAPAAVAVVAEGTGPAAPETAASEPGAWRAELLRQAAERDRHAGAFADLHAQYAEALRGLQNAGARSCGGARGGSGAASPRSREGSDVGVTSGVGAPDALSASAVAEGFASRRLQQALRSRDQELEALRQVLREREEELREKEQAHTVLCREATLLGRENAELRAKLEQCQSQLQVAQRSAQPSSASRGKAGGRTAASTVPGDGDALDAGACGMAAADAFVVPEQQCSFRKIHNAELTCVASLPLRGGPLPEKLVAIGTADGFVKLADGATGRPHAQISVSRELPRLVLVDLSAGRDGGGLLLAASGDHAARLLDLRKQKMLHVLRGHFDDLTGCGFFRGPDQAFTAGSDTTIKLWDLETGQSLRTITAASAISSASSHGPSGVIACGHRDGSLSAWDPRVGDALNALASPRGEPGAAVAGVRVSPDGRAVLSQAEDGTVKLTALGTMRGVVMMEGLGSAIAPSPPALAPDGSYAFARGSAGVRCWRLPTGARAGLGGDPELLLAHEAPEATAVCWDLARAISVHRNGCVAVWGSSGDQVT
eukprot:TRINITY_DN22587_c0_g1_i1.p1 TRINITY_DN22587_c0_g1~~TRINITY_DN22587_c0_g1_i1.p1  ORF type:complete len:572 (+),score=146.06 TRINITY_DN22587_c0_g1_i1:38-1717(+)